MKELTFPDFLKLESIHERIRSAALHCNATHVVCFENQQLDSFACGARTSVMVGPTCTYQSVEQCEGKWLHDLPSQRQYPVSFATL
jgi:hypothetical protein